MLTVRQIVQHPSVVSTMQAINIEFPTLFRQEHHNLIWDIKGPLQASNSNYHHIDHYRPSPHAHPVTTSTPTILVVGSVVIEPPVVVDE
ncbi:hypothetical protein H257_01008 [Aphanomyces astaci]|uniref:Uncharacterized protein n=1 Tax=Aphanomyces astaci TaxID=112090 RepID=W4H775_APHAT|nr:hypothetical protein H257_01008 [Aphanomyces astaci]ETV87426.1 hypothetical protein H257_01008 [Aphanomyces astaci]|eukprot:XP_009822289.1 hypothetical protein H257_01008 [Aphanomyces astaci]